MNAEELYESMQVALVYFGLKFHEKEQVQVTFTEKALNFTYGNVTIQVKQQGEDTL